MTSCDAHPAGARSIITMVNGMLGLEEVPLLVVRWGLSRLVLCSGVRSKNLGANFQRSATLGASATRTSGFSGLGLTLRPAPGTPLCLNYAPPRTLSWCDMAVRVWWRLGAETARRFWRTTLSPSPVSTTGLSQHVSRRHRCRRCKPWHKS